MGLWTVVSHCVGSGNSTWPSASSLQSMANFFFFLYKGVRLKQDQKRKKGKRKPQRQEDFLNPTSKSRDLLEGREGGTAPCVKMPLLNNLTQ